MESFKRILRFTFLKAVVVTLFFALVYQFYNLELVRSKIEDISFDIIHKLILENRPEKVDAPKLMLFGFDDAYMHHEGLFDENNQTNYGYFFPRDRIVRFVADLDQLSTDVSPENCPKALFIDYDISYSSMPYGKNLAKEDIEFLELLKKDRPYIILLPKTEKANLIEQSNDPILQKRIRDGKIVLVSVEFLSANDGITRRYSAYSKSFNGINKLHTYINANVALWNLAYNNDLNASSITSRFEEHDIVANRIILKGYSSQNMDGECKTSQSYWNNYVMYSASCPLFDIVEENFADSIIMLGGTYSENSDQFKVLNNSQKGIELHANTLMSIFYFNGQLKALPFWQSLVLVFSIFFIVDFMIGMLFASRLIENIKLHFTIVLFIMSATLFGVSFYLLTSYALWFNWFVPIVLYETVNALLLFKTKIYKLNKKDVYEIVTTFLNYCNKFIRV